MQQINLNDNDLTAIKQGNLSQGQRATLRRQRLIWLSGIIAIIIIVLGLTAVLILKITNPAFADRGQLFIIIPLMVFWLWLLRKNPSQWRNATEDLNNNEIAQMTGTAETALDMGIGLFRTLQYHVHINQYRFRVGQDAFRQFKNGETYRIYYSPNAHVFLGAISIEEPTQTRSAKDSAIPHPLLDPLTEREMEILHLIAAGLSNKEIAANLSLSTNTIKMYASQLYQKLNVNRRTEAIARAREIGLLDE